MRPGEVPVKERNLDPGNPLVSQEAHDDLVVVVVAGVEGVGGGPTRLEVAVEEHADVVVAVQPDGGGGQLGRVGADLSREHLKLLGDSLRATEQSVRLGRRRAADLEFRERRPAVKKSSQASQHRREQREEKYAGGGLVSTFDFEVFMLFP